MKKRFILGIVFCMVCLACFSAGMGIANAAGPFGGLAGGVASESPVPEEPPAVTERPVEAPWASLDERVRGLSSLSVGNRCDWAKIAGYTVSRGYLDDRYCLIEERDGSNERVAVTANDPMEFVPAGDAYIYYGEDQDGKYNWVIKKPGEDKAKKLSLGITDAVFFADEDFIWYYTYVGEEVSVRKLARKNNEKTGLLRTKAHVIVMREDGGIVLADFDKNCVQSWKDNQYTTLYQPKEEIESVLSNGMNVWVQHAEGLGPIRDGELLFLMSGRVTNAFACSSDQLALLVSPYEGSPRFDVWFFNEIHEAYAYVGSVLASDSTNIEFQADRMIVWGPEESIEFDYPPVEAFQPYGFTYPEEDPSPAPEVTQAPEEPKPVLTQLPAEPTAKPAAQGQSGTSRLLNYEDWIDAEADMGLLETLFPSEPLADGATVRDGMSYPRVWPENLLRGAIPEYKGEGWMYDLFVIHPAASNNAGDLLNVAVTIYEYQQADIDAYVAELEAIGFVETSFSKPEWADAMRCFQADGRMLMMVFGRGEGGPWRVVTDPEADESAPLPYVQLSVDFDRPAYVPSTPDPEQTGLFSFFLFAELIGFEVDDQTKPDMVSDAPVDSYGLLDRTVDLPTQWPREAFQDLIPEYLHNGVLESAVITMPAETPDPERMLITSLYVRYCLPDEVEQYAQELLDYGYAEIPPTAFDEQERALLEEAETLRLFAFPGFKCFVRTDEHEGNYSLQITLRCDGRYMEFFEQ